MTAELFMRDPRATNRDKAPRGDIMTSTAERGHCLLDRSRNRSHEVCTNTPEIGNEN